MSVIRAAGGIALHHALEVAERGLR